MLKVSRLLRWINILIVLVTLAAYLSPYISPADVWYPAFLALAYPWLLLFNILFVLFWLSLKKRYIIFSLGCILLGWGHFRSIVGFSLSASTKEQAQLTIASFNVHSMKYYGAKGKKVHLSDISAIFDSKDPQILCFQEFPNHREYAAPLLNHFKEKGLKHQVWKDGNELAIFSAYPIVKTTSTYFNNTNGFQYADLNIGGNIVRVFNIHLQSNAVSSIADHVAKQGDLQEKETWLEVRGMMGRFKRASKKRALQADQIAAQIKASPYPVIICGDFNDVPTSYAYHVLSKGLKDTFKQKGQGLGFTYLGSIPALRIDYILVAPDFGIQDYDSEKTSFSDHRAIFSTISQ